MSGILDIQNSKTKIHWKFQTSNGDKLSYALVENTAIVQSTFKSSFSCKCQTSCKNDRGRPEFVFKYRINDNDFAPQPTFKYFDNHGFCKLSKHLNRINDFSLFHTNIFSLNANLEKLKKRISNLEIDFSVIVPSETWAHKAKIEVKSKK